MPQLKLTLANLKALDFGQVAAAYEVELERIVQDIRDRPTDGKKRKVALILQLESIDDHGDNLAVSAEVMSVIPKRVSRPYQMRTKNDGTVYFQPESPEDVDQMTLGDLPSSRRGELRGEPGDDIERALKPE